MEINKIVLKFLLSTIVLITKLLKILITTSNINYLKNTLKKSLNCLLKNIKSQNKTINGNLE